MKNRLQAITILDIRCLCHSMAASGPAGKNSNIFDFTLARYYILLECGLPRADTSCLILDKSQDIVY
jgi:hypothetical protein